MLPIYKRLFKLADKYSQYRLLTRGINISDTLCGKHFGSGDLIFKMSKKGDLIKLRVGKYVKTSFGYSTDIDFTLAVSPEEIGIDTEKSDWIAEEVMEKIEAVDDYLSKDLNSKNKFFFYNNRELKKLAKMH